jgi:hypothetical protein
MTPDPASPELRRAAEIVLGLRPGATRDEARAALLTRLPAWDFCPPPDALEAADVLGALPGGEPNKDALGRVRDRFVAAEVEGFGATYWTFTPAERRRRWSELSGAAAASPEQALRLAWLERGLDLDLPAGGDDSSASGLSSHLVRTYPLPQSERLASHRKWLSATPLSHRQACRALNELSRERPELAGLDPEFAELLPPERPGIPGRLRRSARTGLAVLHRRYPEWKVLGLVLGSLAALFVVLVVIGAQREQKKPPTQPRKEAGFAPGGKWGTSTTSTGRPSAP